MIQAYPWSTVPRIHRRDAQLMRKVRRHLGPQPLNALTRWAECCLGIARDRIQTSCEVADALQLSTELNRMTGGSWLALRNRDQHTATLVIDAALCGMLIQSFLRHPTSAPSLSHPTPEMSGVLSYIVAWLLADVLAGSSWLISGPTDAQSLTSASDLFVLRSEVRLDSQGGTAWLLVSRAVATGLSDRCPRFDARALSQLEWRIPIVLARAAIPLHELTDLGMGDRLFLPADRSIRRQGSRFEAELVCGHGSVAVHIEGATAQIVGPYQRRQQPMSDETQTGEHTSTLIEQLDIEIVVELGRVNMLAKELLALGVGDVVTLATPIGSTVDVRANGRLIARGELVDVDGETGVQLIAVYE